RTPRRRSRSGPPRAHGAPGRRSFAGRRGDRGMAVWETWDAAGDELRVQSLGGGPVSSRGSEKAGARGGGLEDLAETEGFEPSVPVTRYDDLANRCLQPLGHVSGRRRG